VAAKKDERGLFGDFMRGLGASTRHNSLAYGYSLAATGAFGVMNELAGRPNFPDVLVYTMGAALTFTLANAVATRGYRYRAEDEPPVVIAFGTSFGFVSIAAALGAAAFFGWALPYWIGWAAAGFFASTTYLVGSALELTFARGVRALVGPDHLEER
jgi:hypothetical protein